MENTVNTLSAYLGPEFQQRLIWQLLVEPEFAEKIIPDLAIEYFDDPNLRRLFIIILEYYNEFDKVPNLQNQSIHQAINKYKSPNNVIEEESLFGVIKRITLWNERIINKQMLYDGDVVQKSAHSFVKQQEYRKIAEHIQTNVKNGGIKDKHIISAIEDRFIKISNIGEETDDAKSVGEGLRNALRKEFRKTIPTGIETIDVLTGGGLGKGEIGVILTPSGVGKTTFLTKVANYAFEQEKNVAQIIFEDTKEQIQRKHSVIWAGSSLSKINEDDEEIERVFNVASAKCEYLEGKGRLIIKRFSQEDTTMKDVRNWMISYEKKWGFKFDMLVLDYLDCLESHKSRQDRTESELTIIKGFEALAADFDIPAWTAIQSNRSGFGAEFVEAHQTGGSIKRIQKAHFFMSVAKTPAQQEAHFANIRIIKARFAKDGQSFEDCIFNNDTMTINIDDPKYRYSKSYKKLKHHDENDIDKVVKKASGLSQMHVVINEKTIVDKTNDDSINTNKTESQKYADLLHQNSQPENNDVVNEGVSEGVNEGVSDPKNLLELNGDVIEAENKVVGDGVNDAVSDGVNTDLLDWSGETTTKIETDVSTIETPPIKKEPIDLSMFKSPGMTVVDPPTVVESTINDDELLKLIQDIDPDAPKGEDKSFNDMLVKKRDYQNVISKE